jgi:hypothetical protein
LSIALLPQGAVAAPDAGRIAEARDLIRRAVRPPGSESAHREASIGHGGR